MLATVGRHSCEVTLKSKHCKWHKKAELALEPKCAVFSPARTSCQSTGHHTRMQPDHTQDRIVMSHQGKAEVTVEHASFVCIVSNLAAQGCILKYCHFLCKPPWVDSCQPCCPRAPGTTMVVCITVVVITSVEITSVNTNLVRMCFKGGCLCCYCGPFFFAALP